MALRAKQVWLAPPNWPAPPPGWLPPYGWRPDPSWPELPPGWQPWQPRPYGRGVRALRVGAVGLLSLLFVGCTALVLFGGPCAFDPPPGDVGTVSVVNDTGAPVVAFDCAKDSCHSGEEGQLLAPGQSAGRNYEMCSGGFVGVSGSAGVLLGCLVLPVGEPPKERALAVSQLTPCAGARPGPVRPSISS